MLAIRPCLPRITSRSLLIPCDDSNGDTSTFCNHAQVTEKSSGPALCSPCKIVIGFEVEAEKKPPIDVCESPRSVLESSAVLSSQDKQQVVARSPRSGLGSLLAAKSGSEDNVGAGHGIIVCDGVKSPSKVTAWLAKTSDHSPMDDNVCAFQEQGLHADMGDELLDADISPLRVAGSCMRLKEEMECDSTTPKPLSCFLGDSGNGGKVAVRTSTEHHQAHANPSKDVGNPLINPYVNALDKESICDWMHSPGHTLPMSSVHVCKGEVYVNSSQEQFWHVETGNHQSIFSASSPPPCSRSLARASSGFLKMCNFCGRSLRLGKDIFMYRGDQPFCSAECRYQKIVLDESKVKKGG